MLSRLTIEGFKAFATRQSIPLKPLTLLYGPNSGGKSSVLQALLMLKQTEDSAEGEAVLVPKGPLVDLGSFAELIHEHDVTRTLSLGLIASASTPRKWRFADEPPEAVQLGIELQFALAGEPPRTDISGMRVYWNDEEAPIATYTRCEGQVRRRGLVVSRFFSLGRPPDKWFTLDDVNEDHEHLADSRKALGSPDLLAEISSAIKELIRDRDRVQNAKRRLKDHPRRLKEAEERISHWSRVRDILTDSGVSTSDQLKVLFKDRLLGSSGLFGIFPAATDFPDHQFSMASLLVDRLPYNPARMAADAAATIKSELNSLVYIGPLREYPGRHYIFSGSTRRTVGKTGRAAPDLLYENPAVVERVDAWLRQFRIGYRLSVISPDEGTSPELKGLFSVRLLPDGYDGSQRERSVSLLDVGFGISQVLPVIVQTVIAQGQILCMEQPEIHLHPALQAELGDLFLDAITGDKKNQIIVETHSEHLLLRIMKRLRENSKGLGKYPGLTASDIGILFVGKKGTSSAVKVIELADDGSMLDQWPGGFFEEGFRERFR